MKRVSIAIPAYNEGANIDRIYTLLNDLFSGRLAHYELEIIFSDNSSTDDTFARIEQISRRDSRVRGISLSRNFGFQINVLSALRQASGDCVIQLDADGEDPPEQLAEFLARWEEGFHVVYGIRESRQESPWLTWQRKIFYRVIRMLSSVDIPVDAGDFRLLDRVVVDILCRQCNEHNLYIRGLVSYIGFRQIGVPYRRQARVLGVSKFSYWNYFGLAWDALTSFSRAPLRAVSLLGMTVSLISMVGFAAYFVGYALGWSPIQGFTTIILCLFMFGGAQLFALGIIGEYIARIFDEVKNRPRGIIARHCGFAKTPEDFDHLKSRVVE